MTPDNPQPNKPIAPDNDSADSVQAPLTATPRMRKRRAQQLSNEIGRLAGSLIGCVVIGWACFNLVKNARALLAAETTTASFLFSLATIAVFCIVPFGLGILLLTMNSSAQVKK